MQHHTKVLTKFNLQQLSKIFNQNYSEFIQFNEIWIKNPHRKETRRRLRWILENPSCVYCDNVATFCKIECPRIKPIVNCFIDNCTTCFYKQKGFEYGMPFIQIYSQKHRLMTIDHIKPKSKGGARGVSNWQTCCVKCNVKKDSNENYSPIHFTNAA